MKNKNTECSWCVEPAANNFLVHSCYVFTEDTIFTELKVNEAGAMLKYLQTSQIASDWPVHLTLMSLDWGRNPHKPDQSWALLLLGDSSFDLDNTILNKCTGLELPCRAVPDSRSRWWRPPTSAASGTWPELNWCSPGPSANWPEFAEEWQDLTLETPQLSFWLSSARVLLLKWIISWFNVGFGAGLNLTLSWFSLRLVWMSVCFRPYFILHFNSCPNFLQRGLQFFLILFQFHNWNAVL